MSIWIHMWQYQRSLGSCGSFYSRGGCSSFFSHFFSNPYPCKRFPLSETGACAFFYLYSPMHPQQHSPDLHWQMFWLSFRSLLGLLSYWVAAVVTPTRTTRNLRNSLAQNDTGIGWALNYKIISNAPFYLNLLLVGSLGTANFFNTFQSIPYEWREAKWSDGGLIRSPLFISRSHEKTKMMRRESPPSSIFFLLASSSSSFSSPTCSFLIDKLLYQTIQFVILVVKKILNYLKCYPNQCCADFLMLEWFLRSFFPQ